MTRTRSVPRSLPTLVALCVLAACNRSPPGTVQVNFFDPAGRMIDCTAVEQQANAQRISLRAGCHCNPGAREIALGFTRADLADCFSAKNDLTFEQFLGVIDGKTTGALRASIGLASNFADVYAYVQFAKTFVDRPAFAG